MLKTLPWLITIIALYFAFRDVDWSLFASYVSEANWPLLILAAAITPLSYLMRSRRWQFMFPLEANPMPYLSAVKCVYFGFFMNNVLPARAGEFVRAAVGAKVSNNSKTTVLATIAAERLCDGLMLSALLLFFALSLTEKTHQAGLFLVVILFAVVGLGVVLAFSSRNRIQKITTSIATRLNHRYSDYILKRINEFISALAPLLTPKKLAIIFFWSVAIWIYELMLYKIVVSAYGAELAIGSCVLFMVSINFSSLVPSAPGAFGVIEAAGTATLVALGVNREQALSMVLTQHVFQYIAVGIPGAFVLMSWNKLIKSQEEKPHH